MVFVRGRQDGAEHISELPSPSHAVHYKQLRNMQLTLSTPCVKVFMQECENCHLVITARVKTEHLEIWCVCFVS